MASTVWKGQLTLGLVSLPVRLYTAARRERVRMHYLQKASAPVAEQESDASEAPDLPDRTAADQDSDPVMDVDDPPVRVERVRQQLIGADERAVLREGFIKGYEVAPEKYVTFQDEELRKLRPATSPDMQILRSVRLAEIDPVYFESSYYVVPNRGGEHAYALLFAALQETQYVAIAHVAMHGREHIMVLRPGFRGLLAHTMFYANEIRIENGFQPELNGVTPKELGLAKAFVEAISGPFAPEEFKDSQREQLQNLISSKAERPQLAASAGLSSRAAPPVVDILEALKKSLDLAKKPAQTAEQNSTDASAVPVVKNKGRRRKA